jgi:two-component system, OmpR family, response regulator
MVYLFFGRALCPPYEYAQGDSPRPEVVPRAPQPPDKGWVTMASVLIVDDDAHIRDFIGFVLEDEGYTVATASNGQRALESLAESTPAVVLLDLQMPVMNGWQLQTRLRDDHSTVPVVFMSARDDVAAQASLYGACGSIAKPFAPEALLAIVGRFARP